MTAPPEGDDLPEYIVKVDGRSMGKGVHVTKDIDEAIRTVTDAVRRGAKVTIESVGHPTGVET